MTEIEFAMPVAFMGGPGTPVVARGFGATVEWRLPICQMHADEVLAAMREAVDADDDPDWRYSISERPA